MNLQNKRPNATLKALWSDWSHWLTECRSTLFPSHLSNCACVRARVCARVSVCVKASARFNPTWAHGKTSLTLLVFRLELKIMRSSDLKDLLNECFHLTHCLAEETWSAFSCLYQVKFHQCINTFISFSIFPQYVCIRIEENIIKYTIKHSSTYCVEGHRQNEANIPRRNQPVNPLFIHISVWFSFHDVFILTFLCARLLPRADDELKNLCKEQSGVKVFLVFFKGEKYDRLPFSERRQRNPLWLRKSVGGVWTGHQRDNFEAAVEAKAPRGRWAPNRWPAGECVVLSVTCPSVCHLSVSCALSDRSPRTR